MEKTDRNPKIQVAADWTATGTRKEIEAYFGGSLVLNGPGLYLSDKDTILAMVCDRPQETSWNWEVREAERYNIYVYNCPVSETIFVCSSPPVRHDSRGETE